MNVKTLCSYLNVENDDNKEIKDIVTSTLDVKDGDLLILVKGQNIDPNLLINKTIENKCVAIFSDDINTPYIYVERLKEKVFDILDFFYFNHVHPFKIVGITGTEGKSSLTQILQQGLYNEGFKTLIISNELSNKFAYKVDRTTPDPKTIINAMLYAKELKVNYLIMEVSSIALSEYRVSKYIFDYLFLTNLEEDHLDYHKNIYQYHRTKLDLLINNKKAVKFVFDDTYTKYPNLFFKVNKLKVINKKDISLKNNSLNKQTFLYKNKKYTSKLIFKQNRFNIVFLIEFLKFIGIHNCFNNVYSLKRIKGRLDLVNSRPYIIVDYAHSIKALENILSQVNFFKQNRIISLIGAGGDRDKSKRSKYGEVLNKYCDYIVLTNDNPRKENPIDIVNQIKGNYEEKFIVELDREKAIKKVIKEALISDIVLILGRGNEEYQEFSNSKIYLNDYEVIKKCLIK